MGAPKSVSARDLSIPDSSPPAKKQENWLFCCSRGAPKFQQSGRLMKKPAAQKLQRSAGAARSAPRVIDFSKADPSKWTSPVTEYDGKFSFFSEPVKGEEGWKLYLRRCEVLRAERRRVNQKGCLYRQ